MLLIFFLHSHLLLHIVIIISINYIIIISTIIPEITANSIVAIAHVICLLTVNVLILYAPTNKIITLIIVVKFYPCYHLPSENAYRSLWATYKTCKVKMPCCPRQHHLALAVDNSSAPHLLLLESAAHKEQSPRSQASGQNAQILLFPLVVLGSSTAEQDWPPRAVSEEGHYSDLSRATGPSVEAGPCRTW